MYVRTPNNVWLAGAYTFELETPDGVHSCRFTLADASEPVRFSIVDCDRALDATFAPELDCSVPDTWCEPIVGRNYVDIVFYYYTPGFVALRLEHEGTLLLDEQRPESAYGRYGQVCRSDCKLDDVTFLVK